jgi:hypothetical protein
MSSPARSYAPSSWSRDVATAGWSGTRASGAATAARAAGSGEGFFIPFAGEVTFFGGAVAVAATFAVCLPIPGAFNGAVIAAPQAHLPFLPEMAGVHRNVLPHAPHENFASAVKTLLPFKAA